MSANATREQVDIASIRDDCQHTLRTSDNVEHRAWATTCLSIVSLLDSVRMQRDGYSQMLDRRGDALMSARQERDAAVARAEAAERVVAQLTEDIERRLVMGVGTISSQHVLRMIGRPWTFEDVSERRLHGSETLSSE